MPKYYNQVAYGLSQGLINEPPQPIIANRAPTANDIGYLLGSLWIFKASNLAYILTSVVSNAANWQLIEVSSGSGVFSSLSVSPGPVTLVGVTNINSTGTAATNIGNATGNTAVTGSLGATTTLTAGTGITSTTGNIVATAGQVNAGTTMTAGTGVTATTGNIVATAGSITAQVDITAFTGTIIATAGKVEGVSLVATGDAGGTASDTTLTNASVAVAGGTGVFSITSTSGAGAGTNAGFLKLYLGVTPIFIPYYTATT